jgi:long-subunit acyl-CoA synthetase (AMP-forming)
MEVVFRALKASARTRPDAVAFREGDTTLSWKELATRVARLTAALDSAPPVIGLGLPGGIDFVVADLAVTMSGRRLVPLPPFFSAEQLANILRDANVGAIIARDVALSDLAPGLAIIDPDGDRNSAPGLPDYRGGAQRVIFTSGSSGRPKGVVHGDRQLAASLRALSEIVRATEADRHLSVLPLAQLLEQICGVFLPILAGAETTFSPASTSALFGGPIAALTEAMTRTRPTTSLLVPALLARWIADLSARSLTAPDSLRFVAVGGAATPPAVLQAAAARGIPVFEGYGLSECCAVVAMNRPGDVTPGTAGRVLTPLKVTIEAGEIVVDGPTVMEGYLDGAPAPARWRTGDRGWFIDGGLVVEGRTDALIVTREGRNISPEWVEARVNADPRVIGSALCLRASDGVLVLLLACRAPIGHDEIIARLADLPPYARPAEAAFVDRAEPGFLFPAGTPNRAVAATLAQTRGTRPLLTTSSLLESLSS